MSEEGKVTEDQATEALHAMMENRHDAGVAVPSERGEEPAAAEAAPAEATPTEEESAAAPAPTAEAHADDLESLKARIKEQEERVEAAERRFQERLQAQQQRAADNERILHDKFLRKATATDRALKTLRATRTEEGVDQAEVDRVISELEGTMNPASASYAQPVYQQPQTYAPVQPAPMTQEDQVLVLNAFLNEKNMTTTEQNEFGEWIRTEAQNVMPMAEQNVARESPGGFLRLAHMRWQASLREKEAQRDSAVGAVKSVQRTQQQAARAAATTSPAPQKPSTTVEAGIDVSKLTPDDISRLLVEAVEENR